MYRVVFLVLFILFLLIQASISKIGDQAPQLHAQHYTELRNDCKALSGMMPENAMIQYVTCPYYASFRARDRFFIQCYLAPVVLVEDSIGETGIYFCPPDYYRDMVLKEKTQLFIGDSGLMAFKRK